MDETHQLVDALKRCVRARGLTYRALAARIGLSEASVKRIFARQTFTIRRLEQICRAMDMSVAELVGLTARDPGAVTTLSLEQESALARDPALLSYFYLLLNNWTQAQVLREYAFEPAQLEELRARLIELRLLEAMPRRRYRLRVSRRLVWRTDGPVRRAYERQVQSEFLRDSFTARGAYLGWQPAELTDSSIGVLTRKLEQLYDEFLGLAELDARSSQPRRSTALLIAFRPWVFSLVAARQRRSTASARHAPSRT